MCLQGKLQSSCFNHYPFYTDIPMTFHYYTTFDMISLLQKQQRKFYLVIIYNLAILSDLHFKSTIGHNFPTFRFLHL